MGNVKNIAGMVYGKLTVHDDYYIENNLAYWLCSCTCGKQKYIMGGSLRSGNTSSCGCVTVKNILTMATTHGLSKHPLYSLLKNINKRCYDKTHKSYHRYGGRGIFVCDEWRSGIAPFYNWAISNGWKKGLDIDRIDNDGPYSPNNCRFVTRKANMNNRGTSTFVTIEGVKFSMDQLEEIYKIPAIRIATRLKNGWDVERAVITPVEKRTPRKKLHTSLTLTPC